MPNWDNGEGQCWCGSGREAGLKQPHRSGSAGCSSGPDDAVGKTNDALHEAAFKKAIDAAAKRAFPREPAPHMMADHVIKRLFFNSLFKEAFDAGWNAAREVYDPQ